jgi:hypothetical protein
MRSQALESALHGAGAGIVKKTWGDGTPAGAPTTTHPVLAAHGCIEGCRAGPRRQPGVDGAPHDGLHRQSPVLNNQLYICPAPVCLVSLYSGLGEEALGQALPSSGEEARALGVAGLCAGVLPTVAEL